MLFYLDGNHALGYTVLMLDGSSGGQGMTETCCVCEKEYIVCNHRRCGEDTGNCLITHSECDENGCGECMNGCDHSPSDEYCMPCAIDICNDAAANRATRRAEDGWRD